THCGVGFIPKNEKMAPRWPGGNQEVSGRYVSWDRAKLDRHYGMWAALAENFGVGVICGEMGCFYKCPHDVMLAWYKDMMESLKERNIGYAVWNFRGTFGIMDSGRDDIELEDYKGHKLDRELLTLLQKY
ncbi:MAG: endoglucanase, partial [Clostridia bacterium]|nr:endoglucanase [Clostridia bacterium]